MLLLPLLMLLFFRLTLHDQVATANFLFLLLLFLVENFCCYCLLQLLLLFLFFRLLLLLILYHTNKHTHRSFIWNSSQQQQKKSKAKLQQQVTSSSHESLPSLLLYLSLPPLRSLSIHRSPQLHRYYFSLFVYGIICECLDSVVDISRNK